jgi:tetratricopeptide (TPR) repeat protein
MELVGLYNSRGDSEHAVPVLQKLVELNPEDADILYVAQRLYRELADDTLNKLAVVAPGSARMQQAIAQRLVNENDLNGAIQHYRKTLEIDPRVPGVHYELGEAIFEAAPGDASAQAEAEQELQSDIAQDGDSSTIQCELGKIALARSDLEQAQAHYARALVLDAGDTSAQLGMGQVLMTLNKMPEARKYLEMAVKSDPLNEAAHYRLSTVYRRLQMPDDAEREGHLFQEIKKTKDQVEKLYQQMNVKPKKSTDEIPDSEK